MCCGGSGGNGGGSNGGASEPEVSLQRAGTSDFYNLVGDKKALGLDGVKIPMLEIGTSMRGAKEARLEVHGNTFAIKDQLKAAGYKFQGEPATGKPYWSSSKTMQMSNAKKDLAKELTGLKSVFEKNSAIKLRLNRA